MTFYLIFKSYMLVYLVDKYLVIFKMIIQFQEINNKIYLRSKKLN